MGLGKPTGISLSKTDPSVIARENLFIGLMASMQFIHIVDFMLVMPLGPDFARTIGMDASKIGVAGGAYTFAAAISTLVCYRFLDQFDRKRAILFAVSGLALTTALTAIAWSYHSLLVLRALAGAFGGPVSALALATISDTVAVERRGRAFGILMAAFSAAAVLGVPIGLELAHRLNWPSAFIVTGAATALIAMLLFIKLPSIDTVDSGNTPRESLLQALSGPRYQLGLSIMLLSMVSIFLLIPHLSAYWQFNRGFPREQLSLLYMAGGVASFFAAWGAGRLVDRYGAVSAMAVLAGCLCFITFGAFVAQWQWPVLVIFVGYMAFAAGRSVPGQTLSSQVPAPERRASYMALQSTVQSLGSGIAAIASSMMISENADHSLIGLPLVASVSIATLLALIWLSHRLAQLLARSAQASAGVT
jgi:predicted MFS family arabinose efflux permease